MNPIPSILVVEDDPSIRGLAETILKNCDQWKPTAVASGEDALRAWKNGHFDLVLMDLRLSGSINGIEVAKKIREAERESGKRTRIVAFTANATVECERQCVAAGFDGFIRKPARIQQILAEIDRLFVNRFRCRPMPSR